MKKVVIIQKILTQYRHRFFYLLKEELLKLDIQLLLVYSELDDAKVFGRSMATPDWVKQVSHKTLKIAGIELNFQQCVRESRNADLVIVENANKHLFNYFLTILRRFSCIKFAYWGHGRNLQSNENSLRNKFKYFFTAKCDWWFGYTEFTKNFLLSLNFPADRITVVQNSIDTKIVKKTYANIKDDEVSLLKNELGISDAVVGIYCGSMYPGKNLGYILNSCYEIKNEVDNFHMIFVGTGVDSELVIKASETRDWIHYVGSQYGVDRVKYFKLAQVQLMPFYVGLGIVDSFALQTPLITTNHPHHGPEIAYLKNNFNGCMTNNNIEEYTKKIVEVLQTKSYVELIEGCKSTAENITLENMVENFKQGIVACLNLQSNNLNKAVGRKRRFFDFTTR